MTIARKTIAALTATLLTFCLTGTTSAVIETFDTYPPHTNSTPEVAFDEVVFWIYSDAPTDSQVIASWSTEADDSDQSGELTGAGIGSNGLETYAFGSGSGENQGPGQDLGIMDFGMQDWGMTSGVIADYLGPNGRDLHGGSMDVRALVSGLAGQIQLGFVSNSLFDDGEGLEWVEFFGPTFPASDSFTWYHGDLNDFLSDADGTTPYGDLPGVKVLGVWVEVFSNPAGPVEPPNDFIFVTDVNELQVDQINLIPEPATLALLLIGALSFIRRRV